MKKAFDVAIGLPREYKTFEQQIQELWASRAMKVLEERFRALGQGKYEWTIIAKLKQTK